MCNRAKEKRQSFLFVIIAAAVITMGLGFATKAFAAPKILYPLTKPGTDSTEVGIRGDFYADQKAALKQINEYRLEACKNGYPDPRDRSHKLTMADYSEVKWSSALETYARLRAAEAAVYPGHARPGSNVPRSESEDHYFSGGECLAWGVGSGKSAANLWAGEKDDWIKGTDAETGHYTSMIDPDVTYVGIGNFRAYGAYGDDWAGSVCGHFSCTEEPLDETMLPAAEDVIQMISIYTEYLGKPVFTEIGWYFEMGKSSFTVYQGDVLEFAVVQQATFPDGTEAIVMAPGTFTYASSNKAALSVDAGGSAKALKPGIATVTAKGSGASYSLKVTVKGYLKKPKITKAKRKGKNITVAFKTNETTADFATGFQIQLAKNKKFTKGLKKATAKIKYDKYWRPKLTYSKTFKKLKKKGTYYIRVRAYMKNDTGTFYSTWSKTKKVK